MAPTVDELRSALMHVGLGQDEATVYLRLALNGPERASALATNVQMARAQAYRVLDQLHARGLVAITFESPRRYQANSVEALMESQMRLLEDRRAELEALRAPLIQGLRPSAEVAVDPNAAQFALMRGRDRGDALARVLAEATRDVVLLSTIPSDTANVLTQPAARRALARLAANDAVSIRASVRSEPGAWPIYSPIAERGVASVRRAPVQGPIQFFVVDGRSVYAATPAREQALPHTLDAGLVTNVPAVAQAYAAWFETIWTSSGELVLTASRGGSNGAAAHP